MNALQVADKTSDNFLFNRILLTGFIAGTLDAAAAVIDYYIKTGKSPVIIFIYIASAVFGKDVFSMSQFIAIIGLLFHFLIATIFSAFYFFIYPKLKFLQWNKALAAIVYGVFVWLVMNMIVVPLSKARQLPFNIWNTLVAVSILIICIGIPITIMASSFYKNRGTMQ